MDFGIWGNFSLMEKAFLIELSVWIFLYKISGYLSVCMQKDVSGWQLFWVIFRSEFEKIFGIAVSKTGKFLLKIMDGIALNVTNYYFSALYTSHSFIWYITSYVSDEFFFRCRSVMRSDTCHFSWHFHSGANFFVADFITDCFGNNSNWRWNYQHRKWPFDE